MWKVSAGETVWQPNPGEPLSGRIVQQDFVVGFGPDGSQSNGSRPVQDKLHAAPSTVPEQVQFAHREVMFQKVLLPAQRHMHEVTELINRANVRWCFRKRRC